MNCILLFLADLFILKLQQLILKSNISISSKIGGWVLSSIILMILLYFSLELSYFIFEFFYQKALKSKKLHLISINAEASKKQAIQKAFEGIAIGMYAKK
jgi:hypothetical protein